MVCPNCFHVKTSVVNSRPHKKQSSIWRRRLCPKCSYSFTSYESPSLIKNKLVHTSNGKTDLFNLGILIVSIYESFSHDQDKGSRDCYWLADTIMQLLQSQVEHLTTDEIAALTHKTLLSYDKIAGLQYAVRHQLLTSS